ncbi:DUF3035 domain-containing protein [Candidatus Pelagibacter sp.]|nr:DUF3035 domain-containing protein [Candidatus Pelagibacter sp.]
MKNLTIFVLTAALLISLTSCGVLKEGFGSPKKENSDEFLVEKKMPLKMPPKFNELPKPSETNQTNNADDNEIKTLISNNENKSGSELKNKKVNKNLKETLLEKIKQN